MAGNCLQYTYFPFHENIIIISYQPTIETNSKCDVIQNNSEFIFRSYSKNKDIMYLLLKQICTIIIQKYESCTQQKNSNYNAESVSERYDIKYFKYCSFLLLYNVHIYPLPTSYLTHVPNIYLFVLYSPVCYMRYELCMLISTKILYGCETKCFYIFFLNSKLKY